QPTRGLGAVVSRGHATVHQPRPAGRTRAGVPACPAPRTTPRKPTWPGWAGSALPLGTGVHHGPRHALDGALERMLPCCAGQVVRLVAQAVGGLAGGLLEVT